MKKNIFQGAAFQLKRMVQSIAFLPAIVALVFLGLSYLMIHVDYSETGKQIKAQWEWLKLKDASTARSIISVIAGGILSLTVFSFSMVMVVLNQAAAQMSNRVLDKLIGNRFQQWVLGFYVGTIVYSLFLLSAIRDVDSGIYVPSLSTYLLIVLAVIDIFLFIYFLHYITQSVKYAVVIKRIYEQTLKAMKDTCRLAQEPEVLRPQGVHLLSPKTGLFTGFQKSMLLQVAVEHEVVISFLHPLGTYVLRGTPLVQVEPAGDTKNIKLSDELFAQVFISGATSIADNFYFGFQQLTEVAVKALSPGINDPGTAVESLRALADLLLYRLQHFPDNVVKDENGQVRIVTRELSLDELFERSLLPIWDYGKEDRIVKQELLHLLPQLQRHKHSSTINRLLQEVRKQKKESK